jgi:hypothetical protein
MFFSPLSSFPLIPPRSLSLPLPPVQAFQLKKFALSWDRGMDKLLLYHVLPSARRIESQNWLREGLLPFDDTHKALAGKLPMLRSVFEQHTGIANPRPLMGGKVMVYDEWWEVLSRALVDFDESTPSPFKDALSVFAGGLTEREIKLAFVSSLPLIVNEVNTAPKDIVMPFHSFLEGLARLARDMDSLEICSEVMSKARARLTGRYCDRPDICNCHLYNVMKERQIEDDNQEKEQAEAMEALLRTLHAETKEEEKAANEENGDEGGREEDGTGEGDAVVAGSGGSGALGGLKFRSIFDQLNEEEESKWKEEGAAGTGGKGGKKGHARALAALGARGVPLAMGRAGRAGKMAGVAGVAGANGTTKTSLTSVVLSGKVIGEATGKTEGKTEGKPEGKPEGKTEEKTEEKTDDCASKVEGKIGKLGSKISKHGSKHGLAKMISKTHHRLRQSTVWGAGLDFSLEPFENKKLKKAVKSVQRGLAVLRGMGALVGNKGGMDNDGGDNGENNGTNGEGDKGGEEKGGKDEGKGDDGKTEPTPGTSSGDTSGGTPGGGGKLLSINSDAVLAVAAKIGSGAAVIGGEGGGGGGSSEGEEMPPQMTLKAAMGPDLIHAMSVPVVKGSEASLDKVRKKK